MYGYLMPVMIFVPIVPTGIGFILTIMNGCGFQTMIGDGLLSTMAGGRMTTAMGGTGFLAMNGHPHGLPGEMVAIIMDGPHLDRVSILISTFPWVAIHLPMITGHLLRAGILHTG